MEPALKQRLIGAVVISALAIYFLPKLIVSHDKAGSAADISLQVPGAPDRNFETKELPLNAPSASTPSGGVVGMDTNAPPLPAPAPTDSSGDANGMASGAIGAEQPGIAQTTDGQPGALPATAPVATTTDAPGNPAMPPNAMTTPVPASNAGGNYVVSLGVYSNMANAQSLVTSLKGAQLPAYTETVTSAGKSSTRVRIGPFAQRADAEAARLRAQKVRSDMPATVTALDSAASIPPQATLPPAAAVATTTAAKPALSAPVASKPATPPAVSPTAAAPPGGFAVQLSAFSDEEDALTLRNKLRSAGFTAYSERVKTDSATLYRVRVGPLADRAAAEQMLASIAQKMSLKGLVVSYP